ncbi:NlpC/P60 family protein [Actinoplanes sp. CA-030573]|uniref:C40 family peptidase n=1 Tax=Actinoplanes sp. CA-030573 TaxID=3239898 RepID=UPI003D940AB9
MATARQTDRQYRTARPWWRPALYSAAATAAIAALFNPVPALAAPDAPQVPGAPQAPLAPAVPDVGSRPMALGTLVLPGQPATTTPPPTAATSIVGAATSPVLQRIEKGRAEIATMGDQLIQLGTDRDLAQTQEQTAEQRYTKAVEQLQTARAEAESAAAQSMIEAAALPPGAFEPGLAGLDDLARIQRGDLGNEQAAARQLENAETTVQLALDEETLAKQHHDDLVTKYTKLNTQLGKKQAAQQALELAHADELSAAESSETAADSQLGAQYLAGAEAGRGADPRAIQALTFALAQRGDPYVWSEEGPDKYDCSGLMYAAYHSVGFPLTRVSRDQYWQTRNKVVDRYSLLPGDLLFFSYSNSWRGIHHVAMYAGDGMMVEAPRTGLNVRLVPVRWTRLFQATRVFGSVEGVTEGPVLGAPDPDPADDPTTTTPDNTSPATTSPTTPTHTTKPTSPATSKPTTTPPTSPSTSPSSSQPTTTPTSSKPTTSPTSSPTPSPTSSKPTTTAPTTTAPTTTAPTPAADPTTTTPAQQQTTAPASSTTTGSDASHSSAAASSATSSANATEEATTSSSPSAG